eukprot:symbB.v1.2.005786.t1/scaffold289.1/size287290/31
MEAEIRLLQVLRRFDQERFWSVPDLNGVVQELEGLDWNPSRGVPASVDPATWNRLGRHLAKLQRILAATGPLRQDIASRVRDITQGLNHCLSCAHNDAKDALPQLLLTHFKALDEAPQVWPTEVSTSLESRCVLSEGSCAVSAANGCPTPCVDSGGKPGAFVLHCGGCRLCCQAPERGVAGPLGPKNCLAKSPPQEGEMPSTTLTAWPMANCPISLEFVNFAHEKCQPAMVGHLNTSHCPDYTLRPSVIFGICQQLDAFNVDASSAHTQVSLSAEIAERVQAALESLQNPNAEIISNEAEMGPESESQSAPSQRTVLSFGGGGQVQEPQALGFEFATSRKGGVSGARIAQDVRKESSGDAPKMVRRSIDWSDTKFLEQLVRLGLKAGDEGWKRSWEELCERKEVAPTFSGQKPPRQVLVEFVEVNLYQTSGKEWAQPLLYKAEGEEDAQIDLPTSDEENPGKLQPGENPEPVLLVGVGEASSSKAYRPEMPDQRDQKISNEKGGPDPDMEVSIQKEDLVPAMTEVGPAFSNAEIGETRKEKKKDKKERKEKKEGDKSKKVKKEKRRLEDESLQACTSCWRQESKDFEGG